MIERLKNRAKFQLERFILRGSFHRLVFIALVIGFISTTAGLLVYFAATGFESAGGAIWWAFLRLTDPGYLGDDHGHLLRTVSTVVTILGYVFFMGALIAIMTQGLNETIAKLQHGHTPIAQKNHFLILGWTNRTATIIEELLRSEERMDRFLRLRGAKKLHVVILAEQAPTMLVQELKERLGLLWNPRQITFRHGSALRLEHLRRTDFLHAAAIILPAGEFTEDTALSADGRTIKTIMAISRSCEELHAEEMPILVSEILDTKKVPLAERAYGKTIEILSSNQIISRLITQITRHAGLSHVFSELLSQDEGNEIYVPIIPEMVGTRFGDASAAFPLAVPLGVVRPVDGRHDPVLIPPADFEIQDGDHLILLAKTLSDAKVTQHRHGVGNHSAAEVDTVSSAPNTPRRVLVLGWNHKVPSLIDEFDRYTDVHNELDIVSLIPATERQTQVERGGVAPRNVIVRQIVGDYTSVADLDRFQLSNYTNVVLLASGRLETEQESDARTILGYLLLQEALADQPFRPEILVELMEPGSADLIHSRADEVLISPLVLSHMLAQVALRRELRALFDEMFGVGGAEIIFREASGYGIAGRLFCFMEFQLAAAARGEIALGICCTADAAGAHGKVVLNPERDRQYTLADDGKVVVLARS